MTSEPQSAAHREQYLSGSGRSGVLPPRRRRRRRIITAVVVEGAGKPTPEQTVTKKAVTTTERLTSEERQVLAGLRLSKGGATAEKERRRIDRVLREGQEPW